jgi:hypothetical protein
LSSQHFLSINTASDSNRKRPAELGCAVNDLLVESVAFGGRLAANEQEPVTLFGLGADHLFAGLLNPRGNLHRITPRLLGSGVVAFFCAPFHDGFGAFRLPAAPFVERALRLIVEMYNGCRDAPDAR